jgi:hypothetical protein
MNIACIYGIITINSPVLLVYGNSKIEFKNINLCVMIEMLHNADAKKNKCPWIFTNVHFECCVGCSQVW